MATQPRELGIKFTADTADFSRKIVELRKGLQDLTKSVSSRFDSAGFQALESQVKAGIKPVQDLRLALVDVIREAKAANQINASPINDKDIADATLRLKALKGELEQTATKAEGLRQRLSGFGQALQNAFLPLAGVTAGATAAIVGSVNAFQDFERTLNTISAVSELTAKELDAIRESSLALGSQTIFSNQQVAESYLNLARAGFSAQEALDAMPGLLQLAAAAGGDLASATDFVSGTLRAFNLQASESGRVADIFAKAANTSNAEINDIGNAFKQLAPIANATGQSIEDMAALLAILANNSVKGADAGSDLRNIITELLNPTKKQADVLKQLGISLQDASGNVIPLTEFFGDLRDKFQELPPKTRAAYASILAGQENLKSFLILAGTGPETMDKFTQAMADSAGAAQQMADKINQGVFAAFEQFRGSVETLAARIGQQLAPAVTGFLTAITEVINVISSNPVLTTLTTTVIGLVAALGGLATVGAIFAPLVTAIIQMGSALGITAAAAGGFIATVAPIVAVIGGLVVAITALVGAYQEGAKALESLKANSNASLSGWQALFASIKLLLDVVGQFGRSLGELGIQIAKVVIKSNPMVQVINLLITLFPQLKTLIDGNRFSFINLDSILNIVARSIVFVANNIDVLVSSARVATFAVKQFGSSLSSLASIQMPDFAGISQSIQKFGKAEDAALNKRIQERNRTANRFQASLDNTAKSIQKAAAQSRTNVDVPYDLNFRNAGRGGSGGKSSQKSVQNDIAQAQKQFQKQAKDIEIELTGLISTEFEKRRLETRRAYEERLAQIQETAQKSGATEKQISQVRLQSLQVYNETLKKINQDEERFRQGRLNDLKAIAGDLQATLAKTTRNTFFDDITAEAQQSILTINRDMFNAINRINDLFRGDNSPQSTELRDASIRAVEENAQKQIQITQRAAREKAAIERKRIQDTIQEEGILRAKATGDQIKAAQLAGEKILNGLKFEFSQIFGTENEAVDQFESALKQFQALQNIPVDKRSYNEIAQLAEATTKLQEIKLNKLQQESQVLRDQREIYESQLSAVQEQNRLSGNTRENAVQQLELLDKIIENLEKELELTSLTARERGQLNQQLEQARNRSASLSAEVSPLGQVIRLFERAGGNFGRFNPLINSVAGGLRQVNELWQRFAKITDKRSQAGQAAFKDFRNGLFQAGATLVTSASGILGGESGALGAGIGSAVGAAVGSFIPGIGTALGSLIGSAAGGLFGGLFGGRRRRRERRAEALVEALTLQAQTVEKQIQSAKSLQELESAQTALTDQVNAVTNNINNGAFTKRTLPAARELLNNLQKAQTDISNQIQQIREAMAERDAILPLDNLVEAARLTVSAVDDVVAQYKRANFDLEKEIEKTIKAGTQTDTFLRESERRRQLLIQQSAEQVVDALIQEQNKIREIRAETNAIEAQNDGNVFGQINADLQAKLVALDNELAAFKGTEEQKLLITRRIEAERTRVIQQSQDSINDVLQQGLDIINEGLVSSETKGQSQQRRLQDLFGSLNPAGLITQGANQLLQTSVQIGTGAFQFYIEGVTNAQDLIRQLSDPLVQRAIQTQLNTAIARA